MRKIQIVGFGLFAVLALCAFNVAPAFAESEWLVEKNVVNMELNAEAEGLLTLITYSSTGVLIEINCSLIFDGTIKEKTDTLLDALALEHGIVVGQLGNPNEEFLSCEVVFDSGSLLACKVGTLALLWVEGLNLELEEWWLTEVLLVGTKFVDDLLELNNLGLPIGVEVECELLLGTTGSELCSEQKAASAELSNVLEPAPANVLEVFSPGEIANRGNCTGAGEHTFDMKGEFNLWAIGAELERLETQMS